MKAQYFFALSLILFIIAIFGLRHNDITSFNMKARILEKDAAGENVEQDIEELKQFTSNHMHASRRFFLKGAYERARTKAQIEADNSIDGSVYEQAQAACDREGQRTTENAECVQNYVQQRLDGGGANVDMPKKEQFTYIFHSRVWATDIPGISIVGGILSLLIGIVLYVKHWWERIRNKNTP